MTSYRKLPGFNGKTIYSITPSVLIEKVLKIKMEYHHLSLDGSVLGVTTSYSDIGYRVFDIKDEEQTSCPLCLAIMLITLSLAKNRIPAEAK